MVCAQQPNSRANSCGRRPLATSSTICSLNSAAYGALVFVISDLLISYTIKCPSNRGKIKRSLLAPLPDVAPVLATWAKVKVYRDAHVQFEQRYYSVPFKLIGQPLWLKATEAMVTLYREQESVATHVRLTRPGDRHTVADHLPSAAQAWQLRDTQWCLSCAEEIGPACYSLVRALFADRVLVKLRAVQGVLRLKQQYGAARLEAACSRANHYGTPHYRAVKTILQKGLDQQALLLAFDTLTATYTEGGRFCRDIPTLLQ